MKDTVKTSRTAGYLEKIFRALNEKYFNNELEEPIITIQSTPKAYAHVTVAKAWQRGDTTRRELNIGAGTLDRSWSITEPTEARCEFVVSQGWDDINMNRIESSYTPRGKGAGNATGKPTGGNNNPNSHSIKYVCPCCGNSVRATKAVHIMCMDCNEPMQSK